MAKTYPNSSFTDYDFSSKAIENATNVAKNLDLTNSTFKKQDASKFSKGVFFDVITAFDSIHDQAEPDKVLANIRKSLKAWWNIFDARYLGIIKTWKQHESFIGTIPLHSFMSSLYDCFIGTRK